MRFLNRHLKIIALLVAISFSACSGTFSLGVQVFAWTKMAGQFLKHDAPKLALKKTFDGKHPCEICKHLHEMRAKQSERVPAQTQIRASESLAFSRAAPEAHEDFLREAKSFRWDLVHYFTQSRQYSPLTPPPRFHRFA